jgi:hypothetical protein
VKGEEGVGSVDGSARLSTSGPCSPMRGQDRTPRRDPPRPVHRAELSAIGTLTLYMAQQFDQLTSTPSAAQTLAVEPS